ncbi:MAG: hypothetical protein LBV23_02455, partial [Deltaproteobacteria bacterium]|nr:hypothetical protein [Deltaproteobacteria bacterium]
MSELGINPSLQINHEPLSNASAPSQCPTNTEPPSALLAQPLPNQQSHEAAALNGAQVLAAPAPPLMPAAPVAPAPEVDSVEPIFDPI